MLTFMDHDSLLLVPSIEVYLIHLVVAQVLQTLVDDDLVFKVSL